MSSAHHNTQTCGFDDVLLTNDEQNDGEKGHGEAIITEILEFVRSEDVEDELEGDERREERREESDQIIHDIFVAGQ
jgi:hypothetical protein